MINLSCFDEAEDTIKDYTDDPELVIPLGFFMSYEDGGGATLPYLTEYGGVLYLEQIVDFPSVESLVPIQVTNTRSAP